MMPDGSVETRTDKIYLSSLGVSSEFIDKREKEKEAFYVSEMYNERIWRDKELQLTDKLMFEDSTYNNKKVRDNNYFEEIIDYRNRLRNYPLRYSDRPNRPEWYKG